jgi:ferredoxin like protein
MTVEEKLIINAIKNDRESHITLDQQKCTGCRERWCIRVCPARLYSLKEDTGEMVVEFAGCLECGSCMVACAYESVTWEYPRSEFGIQYRYG